MLERMNKFFAERINEYDEHMLHIIDGLRDIYTGSHPVDSARYGCTAYSWLRYGIRA
jgi:hypothetical protein